TMVLGAETIRPLLHRLVPEVVVETRPRMSQLTYAGPVKLTKLPQRSAVVAFSAAEVYAIAELIRRRRGGCAVVMGRLSPRTRNAQVALYQDKEVDFLVATDAIGMGLNMDVDHVAFAGISKHDCHRLRRLTAAEMAQIAGRAGRGMRDGSFGSTAACPPLPDELVGQVEAHSFEPIDALCWRDSELDFGHIDSLLASLTTPPPGPGLVKGNDASDLETLAGLAREPDIRHLARGRTMVRKLWEACQIPDFSKLADETHMRLCARVFGHVARDERVPTDWLAGQIAALARADGDLDTLMQRLAGIRVWSYIAARPDWVADPIHWQARAREVEDLLSDALHERLTTRFVDRRAAHLMRRLDANQGQDLLSAVTRRGDVVVEGHPVGRIGGFTFFPDPATDERKLVMRAARRALHQEMPRRVQTAEAADDAAFRLTAEHRLLWDEQPVARLRPGATPLRPLVEILDSDFLDGAQRERLRARLQRFVDHRVELDLAPLFLARERVAGDRRLRGALHRLTEALGVIPSDQDHLDIASRKSLKALGVKSGRFALFLPALLKPRATAMRAQLWALQHGVAVPPLPRSGSVSLAPPTWPAGFGDAMGWIEAGPVLLRLDVAERVAADLGWASRRGPAALPAGLVSRLAIRHDLLPAVLRRLGFRAIPGDALPGNQQGPPAPAMIVALRRQVFPKPASPRPRGTLARGPFAALASLHP
ncbi:MAG TPA: helicase-related protein, partial [Acetobacteraceae bacterium]|nr:helicase-related protein [Acetobacteraceae bacterium]